MKLTIVAIVLCSIFAFCAAQGYKGTGLAEAQWHLRAPERGCIEVSHSVGGSTFRVYACDGQNGPCMFEPHVERCPTSALFHKPSLERVVNIRSRDHLVRFYNQIGGACILSPLPECCVGGESEALAEEECKSLKLPTGEVITDPVGCKPSSVQIETAMDDSDGNKSALMQLLHLLMEN